MLVEFSAKSYGPNYMKFELFVKKKKKKIFYNHFDK